jgi:PAS domain-containing protein
MDHVSIMDSDFLKNIFNAFPSPLFVVDSDVRIAYYNVAASKIMDASGSDVIMKRSGDIMGCVNSKLSPDGCGRSEACKDCVLRNSVYEAIGGNKVFRRKTRMRIQGEDGQQEFHYLITTSPFYYNEEEYVLLIMEDISELIQLRGIIPICAWCKKIRNDDNFWESVEVYFSSHVDVDFSHGMCEECYKKEFGDLKRSKKK